MSNPYCPDIYHGIYLEKQTQDTAKLGFCCLSLVGESIETLDVNSQELSAARVSFEQTPNAPVCSNCWKVESKNGVSRRQAIIEWYKHRGIETGHVPSLVSLDYNTENICNLACITCGPRFSSRWVTEAHRMGIPFHHPPNRKTHRNTLFDSLDVSQLRRVYFNGGEPFLTDDHVRVLKKVNEQGKIGELDVSYNTNGTVMPDDEVIDIWKKCRSVKVMFSVDAVGKAFEFIRYPATWEEINKNLYLIHKKCPWVLFDVTFTLGAHNILYLNDTLRWYEKTIKSWSPHNNFNVQFCEAFGPNSKHLSLSQFTYTQKQKIKSILSLDNYPFKSMIFSELDRESTGGQSFIAYFDTLTHYRGLDWKEHLNKLSEFLDT